MIPPKSTSFQKAAVQVRARAGRSENLAGRIVNWRDGVGRIVGDGDEEEFSGGGGIGWEPSG